MTTKNSNCEKCFEKLLSASHCVASADQGYSLPSAAYPQLPFGSALNTSEAKALQVSCFLSLAVVGL